jgi:hypothetical protein
MTDNQLLILCIAGITAGMATRAPAEGVVVKQNFQPVQQGPKSPPVLYLHKVGDKRIGFMERRDQYDAPNNVFRHFESQWYETTLQLDGLKRLDPAQPNSLTASDLLNVAAGIIQSDGFMGQLRLAGVGILRVTDVRNPYFVDDADRNEADPSFDFVLTHKREYIDGVPVVSKFEFNFSRV